jgi:hypothetical protein
MACSSGAAASSTNHNQDEVLFGASNVNLQ